MAGCPDLRSPAASHRLQRAATCPCGRKFCMGRHYTTSSVASKAAQPALADHAYADPECVSTDLASRHQVGAAALCLLPHAAAKALAGARC